MRLALLDNQDEVVACFQDPEEFDPRGPSGLFVLLDLPETAFQVARKNGSGIRLPENGVCLPGGFTTPSVRNGKNE